MRHSTMTVSGEVVSFKESEAKSIWIGKIRYAFPLVSYYFRKESFYGLASLQFDLYRMVKQRPVAQRFLRARDVKGVPE